MIFHDDQEAISPAIFGLKLSALVEAHAGNPDPEAFHCDVDDLAFATLKGLGYDLSALEGMTMWYA